MKIKVGMLISYDYNYALQALCCVYDAADTITLAIDEECRTWTGDKFEIAKEFFDEIKAIDKQNKITIYKDNFYIPELGTMENDTRERNMLADFMGKTDGWHIQVDSDEYFVNFSSFVNYLHSIEKKVNRRQVTIMADWITLFKKDEFGYYVVNSGKGNRVPIATNYPYYQNARATDSTILVECVHKVLHESWSRSDAEIAQKLSNWSHTTDFNTADYLEFWRSVNCYNVPFVKDFHPLPWQRSTWHSLEFVAGNLNNLLSKDQALLDESVSQKENRKLMSRALRDRLLFFRCWNYIIYRIKQLAKPITR